MQVVFTFPSTLTLFLVCNETESIEAQDIVLVSASLAALSLLSSHHSLF